MTYIDLFAGAGGLSEGFIRQGFEPVAHVEKDAAACRTLETRIAFHELKKRGQESLYEAYLRQEITRTELLALIPAEKIETVIPAEINPQTIDGIFQRIDILLGQRKVDVIVGGPPCQAYSVAGRARDPNRMRDDTRNTLFRFYAEFLQRYQPRLFVFENVTGLLTAGDYFNQMLDLFESKETGYQVAFEVLDATRYGVLQKRERVIIIGRRGHHPFEFLVIPVIDNNWQVGPDLFADLPALAPGDAPVWSPYTAPTMAYLNQFEIRNGASFVSQHHARLHNPRDREIYRIALEQWRKGRRLQYNELPEDLKTHQHRNVFIDRFKVVNAGGHCHTLVAHISKDGHHYIHPDARQARSISVRESARIQSFPDDFYFEGGQTAAFRQIGNAVPPLLAEKIADSIKSLLNT